MVIWVYLVSVLVSVGDRERTQATVSGRRQIRASSPRAGLWTSLALCSNPTPGTPASSAHLGPFAVEDPDRKIAVQAGFRGSRYISAEGSAAGEWLTPAGTTIPGMDAYATSKQGPLATHSRSHVDTRGYVRCRDWVEVCHAVGSFGVMVAVMAAATRKRTPTQPNAVV